MRTNLLSSSYLRIVAGAALTLLVFNLTGCGTLPVAKLDGHINNEHAQNALSNAPGDIPQTVSQIPLPPPPVAKLDEVRYSITVNNVPVQELLFAIGRDTKVNIDIHPGIEGRVTLNAINQTLRQILTRISKQVDMRYETDGPNLVVMPDAPYLKIYKVDYVNMSRDSSGSIGVQTQVTSLGATGSAGGAAGGAGQNSSQLKLDNTVKNRFWESLEKNLKDILRETDKLLPEGSSETIVQGTNQASLATTSQQINKQGTSLTTGKTNTTTPGITDAESNSETFTQKLNFREAASVIVNSETGTIVVRATARQQEKVSEFIEQISGTSKRQVLIEATVVEVLLNDAYQSGVDWSALGLQGLGYSIRQSFTAARIADTASTTNPFFSVQYNNPSAAAGGSIGSTLKLLNSFGTTKVLSSPKIMTLNNQTAVMRVVDSKVYFTITVTPAVLGTNGNVVSAAITTATPTSVPQGFVMNVTPQISDNDIVSLNVRPSVTRITGFATDPTLAANRVPEIQTREFETMLRIPSGQTAILGGLMQDSFVTSRDGLPVLSRLSVIGDAVSYRNDTGNKSELVVFLRPLVIHDASIDGDLSDYKKYLPDSEFFHDSSPSYDPKGKSGSSQPATAERAAGRP